jgi:hypothetical protein
MELRRTVDFEVPSTLTCASAVTFVRDVERSLADADFLTSLARDGDVVTAQLPVNAALFGAQKLRFRSRLVPTPSGARLEGLDLDDRPGWARVSGEATVVPIPDGCRLDYRFEIEIHLAVPEAERWGGRALLKMIEVTADRVLARVTTAFPDAVRSSARAYEELVAA